MMMKKRSMTIWMVVVITCLAGSQAIGVTQFRDGQTHNIDYRTAEVWVDWQAPRKQTTLNLLDGGRIFAELKGCEDSYLNILGGRINGTLYAWDRSRVTMSGGSIDYRIRAWNNSQVTISGGQLYYLQAYNSTEVNISGGLIRWRLRAYNSSQVSMSGGSIGGDLVADGSSQVTFSGGSINKQLYAYGTSQVSMSGGSIGWSLVAHYGSHVSFLGGSIGRELIADQSGVLTIHGSEFAVGGVPFGYGELTSIFGSWYSNEPYRHLTGILASGDLIDNDFRIGHNAKIVLVPEPATLLLLCLGAVILRRKR